MSLFAKNLCLIAAVRMNLSVQTPDHRVDLVTEANEIKFFQVLSSGSIDSKRTIYGAGEDSLNLKWSVISGLGLRTSNDGNTAKRFFDVPKRPIKLDVESTFCPWHWVRKEWVRIALFLTVCYEEKNMCSNNGQYLATFNPNVRGKTCASVRAQIIAIVL